MAVTIGAGVPFFTIIETIIRLSSARTPTAISLA